MNDDRNNKPVVKYPYGGCTAYTSIETAVEAMRRGATDYIPKLLTLAQVKLAVDRVFEMRTLEQRVA